MSDYRLSFEAPSGEPGDHFATELIFLELRAALHRDPELARAIEEAHEALTGFSRLPGLPPVDGSEEHRAGLDRKLDALRVARVNFTRVQTSRVGERLEPKLSEPAPAPAPRAEESSSEGENLETTWFEVKLVDELGEPIEGVDLIFNSDDIDQMKTTDSSGIARIDDSTSSFGSVRFASPPALRGALKSRWDSAREGEYLEPGQNITRIFLRGNQFEPIDLQDQTPHTITVQPYVMLAQLFGMFFDTNKNFLLPTAISSIRGLKQIYDQNPETEVLVVGHTDTSGKTDTNDTLSLERAEAIAQYLTDDADGWLAQYESSVPAAKRWGREEDMMMVRAMPDFGDRPPNENAARWYQSTRGLKVDGEIGPRTRAKLIKEYMSFDETTLPEDLVLLTHGCGEHFPLDESGEKVDSAPKDGQSDQTDRRVELFFFDRVLGAQPPPPSTTSEKGSTEYPEWRRRARETKQLGVEPQPLVLELEWAEDVAERLASVSIVLEIEGGEPIEQPLSAAARAEGVARLSFRELARDQLISATAKSGDRELILFREQRAGDVDAGLVWEHHLEELLEPEEVDQSRLIASGGPTDEVLIDTRIDERALVA